MVLPATGLDLAVEVLDSPDPVVVNRSLAYRIAVTNNGPDDAKEVVLTDHLPNTWVDGVPLTSVTISPSQGTCTEASGAVECTLGRIDAGAAPVVVTIAVVPAEATAPGLPPMRTKAWVSDRSMVTGDPDLVPSNNVALAETVVLPATGSDLAITQSDDPDPVVVNNPLSYALRILNNGPEDAPEVLLTDQLPHLSGGSRVAFLNATPSQGTCTEGGGMVLCNLGRIPAGAAPVVVTIESIATEVTPALPLVNEAWVSPCPTCPIDPHSTNDAFNSSNNISTEATVVLPGAAVPTAPVAADDAYSTIEDEVLVVPGVGVLHNDRDANGDSLTVALVTDVSNGTLTLSPDGSFKYTPSADFFGIDAFSYRVSDGRFHSGTATVTIAVQPVNDAPTLDPIADLTVDSTAGEQIVTLAGIGSGAANESQELTVTATSSATTVIPHPTVSYASPDATGALHITPVAGANGAATVTVRVRDDGGVANGGVDTATRGFRVTASSLPTVAVVAADATAAESGNDPGAFTLTRTGPTTNPLTVTYAYGGTATPESDFLNSGGIVSTSLKIPAGATQAQVDIYPVDDTEIEGPETVVLTLQPNPGNYEIGTPASQTLSIADNEPIATVWVEPFSPPAKEGGNLGAFLVSRSVGAPGSPPPTGDLVVQFRYGGTATPGLDFFNVFVGQSVYTEVTIPDGASAQTVAVFPIDDSEIEGTETVELILEPNPGVYVIGIPASATLNILDND